MRPDAAVPDFGFWKFEIRKAPKSKSQICSNLLTHELTDRLLGTVVPRRAFTATEREGNENPSIRFYVMKYKAQIKAFWQPTDRYFKRQDPTEISKSCQCQQPW